MPPVTSVSGAQSAAQSGWQQLKLQQAQRNATQAEQNARALEAQASNAKRDADRAQDNARSLEIQSGQARDDAGRARQGLAAIRSTQEMQVRLGNTVDQAVKLQSSTKTASTATTTTTEASAPTVATAATASTTSSAAPVINTQGETTGRIINITV
jgi:hypothetical protein